VKEENGVTWCFIILISFVKSEEVFSQGRARSSSSRVEGKREGRRRDNGAFCGSRENGGKMGRTWCSSKKKKKRTTPSSPCGSDDPGHFFPVEEEEFLEREKGNM
jgi:hypothetical protein